MKLTGGQAGGLRIDTPAGKRTRPSTDRLRESLFAMLTPYLPGSTVLDLYAGSGSLGLEAASRGASEVVWVEQHGPTVQVLKANVERLRPAGVDGLMRVERGEVFRWLSKGDPRPVDVILADPPYADWEPEGALAAFLGRVEPWLAPGGRLILESESRLVLPEVEGWDLVRQKNYGSSAVSIWMRSED